MREKVKEFLTDPHNLNLIQNNEWGKIYSEELDNYNFYPKDKGDFAITLLQSGINPLNQGLNYVPEEFLYDSNIKEFIIPNNVKSIKKEAFCYCVSLTSIEIPDNTTSIDFHAFRFCSSLTSIEIPDSVTSIGDRAFEYCSSLTSVEIGDSVTNIGFRAFYGCSSLARVKFNGTTAEWNSIKKETRWNQSIPATKVICNNGEIIL